MEKLIILLLVAIGSAISSYFQNKRKREEEEKLGGPQQGEPPIPHWPQTGRDWQEEVRRILGGEVPPKVPAQPPRASKPTGPVIRTRVVSKPEARPARPVEPIPPNPLKQSGAAYARANALSQRVERRLEAVDALTKAHPSARARTARPTSASESLRRWTRNRQSLREAFVASLIFSQPVALRTPAEADRPV